MALELFLLVPVCTLTLLIGIAPFLQLAGLSPPGLWLLANPFSVLMGLGLGFAWIPARRWRRALCLIATVGQILCVTALVGFFVMLRQIDAL